MYMISRREVLQKMTMAFGAVSLSKIAWNTGNEALEIWLPDSKNALERPVTAITLGAGARGNTYGGYALKFPDRLKITGVAEPVKERNQQYTDKHNIEDKNRFHTWEQVFERPKFADAVIITTPDDVHFGPCMKALEMGYDILLEKPIAPTEKECRAILKKTREKGRIVAVCHVLRYAPYFIKLREIIQSGVLGKVVSLQHFEPIEHIHMSHSYVRGNWHNSKKTTPIILAKSCHDLDIMRWLLNKPCLKIQAFGSLDWFTEKNSPKGSTARCTDGCLHEPMCPYSALKIYHQKRSWTYVFDLPKKKEQQGDFILDKLKTTNYGRCVYKMENDQPDHYTANILFEDNITAGFSMEAFTSYAGRRTRVMGSLGDITGDMTSFTYTDFLTGEKTEWKHDSDGHGGGDWRLVDDWVGAVSKQDKSLLSSTIEASIESHIMGFCAEKSREKNQVVNIRL
jgi:predicted dehydrogenase